MVVCIKILETEKVVVFIPIKYQSVTANVSRKRYEWVQTPCGHLFTDPGYRESCNHLDCARQTAFADYANSGFWRLLGLMFGFIFVLLAVGDIAFISASIVCFGAAIFWPEDEEGKRLYRRFKGIEEFQNTEIDGLGTYLGQPAQLVDCKDFQLNKATTDRIASLYQLSLNQNTRY
jgi:hypothetical protein